MLLQTQALTKSFGRLIAVNEIDIEVQKGDLHAIIGPNGAGKSTFFNLLSGLLKPDSGKIFYRKEEITKLPPHRICQMGISKSFQVASIYPLLSVFENVQGALFSTKGKSLSFFSSAKKILVKETYRILENVELVDKADIPGGELSQGDRKQLELGIVLANEPELLLLDEPTAGMSPEETTGTMELIKRMRNERDLTIIFTEHDMSVVFGMATRISVLHQGSLIADGEPEKVRADEKVHKIYLGEEAN